jgi:hypothetical protein
LALLADVVPVHHYELVHEVVGEGLRLLTEEIDFVAFVDECAAEILNVDVAACVRKHVPVCHDQLHVTALDSRMLPKLSIILAQQDRVQRTMVSPLQAPRCSSVNGRA